MSIRQNNSLIAKAAWLNALLAALCLLAAGAPPPARGQGAPFVTERSYFGDFMRVLPGGGIEQLEMELKLYSFGGLTGQITQADGTVRFSFSGFVELLSGYQTTSTLQTGFLRMDRREGESGRVKLPLLIRNSATYERSGISGGGVGSDGSISAFRMFPRLPPTP